MTVDLLLPTLALTMHFAGGDQEIGDLARNGFALTRGSTQPSFTGLVADDGHLDMVIENFDRAFDPSYVSSPYYPDVIPGVSGSLVATWDGTDYQLFTGDVDGWNQQYGTAGLDQIVPLTFRDAVSALAQAQVTGAFPRQLTGARIAAIIAATGLTLDTDLDPGTALVPAIDEAGGAYAWALIADAVAAEWGYGWVTGANVVTFRDRDGLAAIAANITPQAVFGDRPDLGELPYDDIDIPFDKSRVLNLGDLSYSERGAHTVQQDLVSQAQPWRIGPWRQSIPMASSALAVSFTKHLVHTFSAPSQRISYLKIKPQDDPDNLFPIVLALEPGQMFTGLKTPIGGGARIERDLFVRSVSHGWDHADWTTEVTVDDADVVSVDVKLDGSHKLDGSWKLSF